ncbi:hypothetical protein ANRL2_03482 [Anaerolineae bacterium]|nr:hypothetical protein ANRL2_03482 [Anaerolineae bacterium]
MQILFPRPILIVIEFPILECIYLGYGFAKQLGHLS